MYHFFLQTLFSLSILLKHYFPISKNLYAQRLRHVCSAELVLTSRRIALRVVQIEGFYDAFGHVLLEIVHLCLLFEKGVNNNFLK